MIHLRCNMRDMVVLLSLDGGACRSMARKLRGEHIYCKILPAEATAEDVLSQDALGVLLAGGSKGEPAVIPHLSELLACGLPVMAMGDAALSACLMLGGSLGPRAEEPGVLSVHFENDERLFQGVEDSERYLPAARAMQITWGGAMPIAISDSGVLGFRDAQRPVYALAFQAERNDLCGTRLLFNFCHNLCGCTLWWSHQAFVGRAREEIERLSMGGGALCALSGGLDSGVCAMLGNMALGHRLTCIFVDTGLMRKDEAAQVMAFYRDRIGLNVHLIEAQEEFMEVLRGIEAPRDKEAVIFRLLRDILTREAAKFPNITLLIQGTNYSDTLTKAAFPLALPSPGTMLVEPLRELFKDEIRRVGEELGLPPFMALRQPFPGSGLATRILAEVTPERLRVLREADAIFRQEMEASGQDKRLWQYFATLAELPFSGGGMVITLRAVQAVDGAAAMPARLPSDLLERVSQAIRETLPSVIRVLYDLTPSSNYEQVDWK